MATKPTMADDQIYIASAANFVETLQDIVNLYQKSYPNSQIEIVSGSTAGLYNQIINGAPFDIFFSSDEKHIDLLIEKKLVAQKNSSVYAIGQLVLWSSQSDIKNSATEILQSKNFNHLAIANPELAPYGLAAKEVLNELHLFDALKDKLIYGRDISATMNYVATKNADLGFVALSQIISWQKKHNLNLEQQIWIVPVNLYKPIRQKSAILNQSLDKKLAQDFFKFTNSAKAKNIIKSYGYELK